MAGNYPDAPANRFEVDRDGTVGASITSAGAITTLTTAQLQSLNDESDSSTVATPGTNGFIAYIFPQLRDVAAIFFSNASGNSTISVSTNTTNGFDGTWTTVLTTTTRNSATNPGYRSNIETLSSTGIKGIRVSPATTNVPRTFHVYGKISAVAPDKLELWHPTLDQPLYQTPAALDYGNIARGASADLTFRLKNLSASLTASTITVSAEALTDSSSPTVVSGLTFDYNGSGYAATASLASLAPSTISSGLFTLRNTVSTTQTPGLWSQRVVASAASWA